MMKFFLQKRLKNEKGLTLVELLAVIVILGIIAAIAVPSIGNVIKNSHEKAIVADALNIFSAADLYLVENPEDTQITVKDLVDEGFLDNGGSFGNDENTFVEVTKQDGSYGVVKTFTGTGNNGGVEKKFAGTTKENIK